jgi:hypothetical protein
MLERDRKIKFVFRDAVALIKSKRRLAFDNPIDRLVQLASGD